MNVTRCSLAAALALAATLAPLRAQQVTVAVSGTLTDPVACEGVVYFGSDNGKLYAVNATDGSSVPGFPVDIKAAVEDGSYPLSRPGVYYGSNGKAIYLETSKHGIVKVWPNGTVAWVNKLAATSPAGGWATPAVTPDGDVFAELKSATSVYLAKLNELDGSVVQTSPALSMTDNDYLSSPSVFGDYVYLTVMYNPATSGGGVVVLNRADLTVKASLGGTHMEFGIPYVRGANLFVGGGGYSQIFKLNAVTLTPDLSFGKGLAGNPGGFIWIGTGGYFPEVGPSPPSADRDPGGTVYAFAYGFEQFQSVNKALLVAIDALSGSTRYLVDEVSDQGNNTEPAVNSRNVVGFSILKSFRQLRVDGGETSFSLPQYPGRPTYDPTTGRFYVTTTDRKTNVTTYLYGFNSL